MSAAMPPAMTPAMTDTGGSAVSGTGVSMADTSDIAVSDTGNVPRTGDSVRGVVSANVGQAVFVVV